MNLLDRIKFTLGVGPLETIFFEGKELNSDSSNEFLNRALDYATSDSFASDLYLASGLALYEYDARIQHVPEQTIERVQDRCPWCNRRYYQDQEVCNGCGAPI